ncbi:lysozyme [Aureimonas ureilytica]|uniref:lysozyme n=1 Tax=Aureimonas ureilytica TaxID=401562 RepID=UPI001FCCE447|nr:lysozyme [Aureimonas ureilytica]
MSLFRRSSKPVARISPAANQNTKPKGRVTKTRLVGAVLASAIGVVAAHEGLRTKAYIPIPGDVPTICFGETRGVRIGDTKTVAECHAMLGPRLQEFETAIRACLTNPDAIPDKPYVAFLSVTYNIGSAGFCGSSMARLANAGDLRGACDALLLWDKSKGKRIPGLTRRRREEREMCLAGLNDNATLTADQRLAAFEKEVRMALYYLDHDVLECERCTHQHSVSTLDAAYTLRSALRDLEASR